MRSTWKVAGAAILALSLGGCFGTMAMLDAHLPEKHVMEATFDPKEAAYVLEPGTSTIEGTLTVPDQYTDDSLVPPAGSKVNVYPDTAYARERMKALFGDGKVSHVAIDISSPFEANFKHMTRIGRTDHTGRFTIYGVPAGTYFIVGTGFFPDAKRLQKSALVYDRILLADDQQLSVTLDGR